MRTNFLPQLQRIPLPVILGAGKALFGLYQNIKANEINPEYDDSFLRKNVGMYQNLFNGRMAGATNLENNIANAQQNTISNAQRGATDASQALALASASQGTANQAYNDLQTKEAQNKYAMADHLSNAYTQMNNQLMQKYQMDSQAKAATRNSAWQNIFGGANDVASSLEQDEQRGEMDKMWNNYGLAKGMVANPNMFKGMFTQPTTTQLPPLTDGMQSTQQLQSLLGDADLSGLSQSQINQLLGFIRR